MDVFESLNYFVNWWSESLVSNKDEFEEVFNVLIVADRVQIFLRDQFLSMIYHPYIEVCKIWMVQEKFSRQELVKQAPHRPNVAQAICANLFSSIIFIMIFSGIYRQLEHLRRFDWVSSSVARAELIFVIWKVLAFSKVTNGDFKIIFSHISYVNIFQSFGIVAWSSGSSFPFSIEVDEYIVAFDIVMSDIVRMNCLYCFQHLVVNGYIQAKVLIECFYAITLIPTPLSEWAGILLHHYVVRLLVNAIIIEIGDAFLKPELLKACNLCKYVMKHASIINVRWKVHSLDCNWAWLYQVGLAFIDCTIRSLSQLSPSAIAI